MPRPVETISGFSQAPTSTIPCLDGPNGRDLNHEHLYRQQQLLTIRFMLGVPREHGAGLPWPRQAKANPSYLPPFAADHRKQLDTC